MKIRILEPVMLRGEPQKPGTVLEVTDREGVAIVSVGRGEWFADQPARAGTPNAETKVEVREPEAETRDPEPTKGGKRGR